MSNISDQAASFSEQVENIVRIIKHGKREQVLFLAGFLCLGLPLLLPKPLQEVFPNSLKQAFSWLTVISIAPIAWGIVLVWKKAIPRKMDLTGTVKPSAIKGPFAFGEMDGEIFSQLGRESDLSKLLGWVLDSQICFVALKGESGAGKTSLLRAGLVYTLTREKEKYGITPIYWEAVPENPTAELLRTIHLVCPEVKGRLQNIDDLVNETSGNKKVIIIDQAEQLSPEKHPALFDLFKKIVAQRPPYATTWIVAFREEYASTWFDFESANPDFLPPKHSLKIFAEHQARDIIAILARESGLTPDNAVIVEMVNAMSDKGKVSPVEIGIGMMVLSELYSGPDSEISLGEFKDAGGVTGLLRSYVKGKLEEGMPEHEHSPMQNALLDLIDPENSQQRLARGKSAHELASIAQLPLGRIQHNLRYLASPKARILEQLQTHSEPEANGKYRLAHERLIPALESLAGEMLAAADQTKRLLNERFRTWVNTKQRRFLLSGKELSNVLKYRGHFAAALNPELLHYIRQSKKMRYIRISLGILFVLCLLLWQPFNENVVEPIKRDQRLKNFKAQFVAVEGGVFDMGDSSGTGYGEAPVHKVRLTDFKISRYETTNQQFCDFLNSDDSARVKASGWLDLSSSSACQIKKNKNGRFAVLDESMREVPVVTVNWFGAAAFCNYLNQRSGYKPSYVIKDWSCDFAARGFRLPTEAEWEFAARGGNKSKGYRYSGSDSIDIVAWIFENFDREVHVVGKKGRNELGLYDMSGNVWEWCQDWYDEAYYDECKMAGTVENPAGPENGSTRVLRGGGWRGRARFCRSAYRSGTGPADRGDDVGFRLVFVP